MAASPEVAIGSNSYRAQTRTLHDADGTSWAELIARGKKKKEFRTWSRSCFGELLIVASKSVDAEKIADEGLDIASLVFGRAVCVVDFYKVTGDEGDYVWYFRDPRRVEPVEVRGGASLYRVPDERVRPVARAARGGRAPSCPVCGADKAIPIVYGLPGPELWEGEQRGVAEIGGCVVTVGYDPAWRCRKCREAFGRYESGGPTTAQAGAGAADRSCSESRADSTSSTVSCRRQR